MKNSAKSLMMVIIAPSLMLIFIIFLFSLPSTYGIFKWNEYYKNLLLKLFIIPIIIAFFGLTSLFFINKKTLYKIFYLISLILNIIFIIIIISAITFILINSNPNFQNIPPFMTLLDSTGIYGIPDIGISFKTEKKEKLELNYFIKTDIQNKISIKNSEDSFYHDFIIKDLKPDSEYIFEFSNGKNFTYKTIKNTLKEDSPFVFSVSSDPHFGRDKSRKDISQKITQIIQQKNENSFFAILGDFVESGYVKSHWKIATDFLSENLVSLPIIAVMGNHDSFIGGHRIFKKFFSPFILKEKKSPFYKHYIYNLANKKIHIISLSLLWGTEDFSIKQKNFLIKELMKTNKDDFVIILSHAFIYASGYTEEGGIPWYDNISAIKTLEPIFKKYDVDLVLSGHNHTMELLENDSIYYGIIGSFGGLPDTNRTFTSKGSLWYASGKYGYATIRSYPQYFDITYYDESGNILFTNKCKY